MGYLKCGRMGYLKCVRVGFLKCGRMGYLSMLSRPCKRLLSALHASFDSLR